MTRNPLRRLLPLGRLSIVVLCCGCAGLPDVADAVRSSAAFNAEVTAGDPLPASDDAPGEVTLSNHEIPGGIVPAAFQPADPQPAAPQGQQRPPAGPVVIATPPEPRVKLENSRDWSTDVTAAMARLYPDEYLLDGGDRDHPVHYDDFNRQGLDTEDTVAEYTDHEGDRHVQPSNQVAVYAPRFGAVRSVSQTEAEYVIHRLAGAHDAQRGVGMRNRAALNHHRHLVAGQGVRVRSRASGMEHESRQVDLQQTVRIIAHEKLLNAFEEFSFLRTGNFRQGDEAWLAAGIQAALAWSRDEGAHISATTASAQDVYASSRAAQVIGREDQRKTKGRLRIVKLADKKTASSGDIVTFTIRYDNLGDRELYHVRIVDNLTPRLEFVEESADSDRDGRLVVHDNEEGSLVLEFQLDEPLPGHQGGVVTFQARVR